MRGGAESYSKELADYMSQRHEVHVISGFSHLTREQARYQVHTVKCGWYRSSPVTFLNYFNPKASSRIRQLISQIKPDVVHLHNTARIGLNFLSSQAPVVQTIHDFWYFCPRSDLFDFRSRFCENKYIGFKCIFCRRDCAPFLTDALRKTMIKQFLACIALFVFPSETVMRSFIERDETFKRCVVIRHGIMIRDPPQSYEVSNPLRVLFVGRLSKEKGVNRLIRAVQNVESLHLDVIGGGDLEKSLKKRVENEGIANVEIRGFLAGKEKWSFYEKSDVVVVPSLWPEVSPIVAMEAMSKGNVVIVTNMGGAHELVDNGVNGFVVEPDQTEIRDKLLYLAKNPRVTRRMKIEARKKAESSFGFDSHARNIEKCYDLLLQNTHNAHPQTLL
jgi:glycosyltransferase involved in cell wall biosynthesis